MVLHEKANEEKLAKWHDDPSNWRLGVFYYNKKDKRLFPPKRLRAFGWTVNFANPYSYSYLAGDYYLNTRHCEIWILRLNLYISVLLRQE
jgi:hypothetical protein